MTRRRLLRPLALAIGMTCGAEARAEERPDLTDESAAVAECVASHERAGILRLEQSWEAARTAMNACAAETCPLAIRADCGRWLEELRAMLPTLLVVVERDDDGRHPVRLSLDGRELDRFEPLRPIEVLPGTHRLEFSLPSYAPVSYEVSVDVGEKNRVVRVRFEREPEALPAPAAPAPSRVPAPPPTATARPVPAITYLLAGGSILAASASGGLLAAALSRKETAEERCAPGCYDGQRDEVDDLLLGADLAGAASLVFAGLAVYTFVSRPTLELPAAQRVGISLVPAPGVALSGAF
jgi:hypothetical protein